VTAAVFAGRAWHEVATAAERHADRIVAGWLRADTCARLAWHRDQGHAVVLVSAGYEVYLRHVAAHLGVDALLATRLAVDGDRCTGALDGPNCRGPEKVVRLTRWLDATGSTLERVTLWAYGDSAGDRELLAAADHPVRVTGAVGSVAPTPARP
jgi:phosphatidylglycerophosphatase C